MITIPNTHHCEATQIGQQICELNQWIIRIEALDMNDALAAGTAAPGDQGAAIAHFYDELALARQQICFAKATTTEGALHLATALLSRVGSPREHKIMREESDRQTRRLVWNLIGFFENQPDVARNCLRFGGVAPLRTDEEIARTILDATSPIQSAA